MQTNRTLWPAWIGFLQNWGLEDLVATVLEVSAPIAVVGAQMLYMVEPMIPMRNLRAVAGLLENPVELHTFAMLLREESPQ